MDTERTFTCKCGCGESLLCQSLSDMISISILRGNFSFYQKNDKIQMTVKALRHKNLTEVILTDEQVEAFIEYIRVTAEALLSSHNPFTNEGSIHIENWCDKECAVYVTSNMHKRDLLRGKIYRVFEICFNKAQAEAFTDDLQAQLEKIKAMENRWEIEDKARNRQGNPKC